MSLLFSPLTLRGLTIANRAWVSPMCQYSATDGLPDDWHLVHLASRAVGGAGLVFTEATAVEAIGRISPADTGVWNDEQTAAWRRITDVIHDRGAATGIQLSHAGRKASSCAPWEGSFTVPCQDGGWQTIGPTGEPFGRYAAPRAMDQADLDRVREAFVAATTRSVRAGFDVIEVHAAHGYLLHQFLSPLVNTRTDEYGGDRAGRMRYPLEVIEAVRAAWPDDKPLFVRISATDWIEGGWSPQDSVVFAAACVERGVDLIDCSTGGAVPGTQIPVGPGYQVAFAAQIRAEAGVPTGAIGMITEPDRAEDVLVEGRADAVLLARELLRDPYWPLHAAAKLGDTPRWPVQYQRAAQ